MLSVSILNPAEVPLPKRKKKLPYVLSRQEIQLMIGKTENIKHRLLIEMLYSTGIRLSELLGLRVEDIDFEGNTIRVRQGKGAKDRVIPIGKNAAFWVERYLKLRQGIRPDLKEIFLSDIFNLPVGTSCLCAIIRRYVTKAGISKTITPHSLRHTYATHLLQEGANLAHIQALLGHSSLDSTQIYTRVAMPDIKKAHSLAHPREKSGLLTSEDELNRCQKQFNRTIEPRQPRRSKKHAGK